VAKQSRTIFCLCTSSSWSSIGAHLVGANSMTACKRNLAGHIHNCMCPNTPHTDLIGAGISAQSYSQQLTTPSNPAPKAELLLMPPTLDACALSQGLGLVSLRCLFHHRLSQTVPPAIHRQGLIDAGACPFLWLPSPFHGAAVMIWLRVPATAPAGSHTTGRHPPESKMPSSG
jgi:hypothetical protein